MLPLFHDFTGKRVVIFGGGAVAARKAAYFAPEAHVIVVSITFHERFSTLECDQIRLEITPERAEPFVTDAFLVIPATDDASLNDALATNAETAGALVNRVDRVGQTVTPSLIETETVAVAIATGGQSPAVSKYLRRQLEPEVGRVDPMVRLQARLRTELDDRPDRRQRLWDILEDERVWAALENDNFARAERLAREHC